MDKRQLKATLDSLHAELSTAGSVDEDTAESLRDVAHDIDRLLATDGKPDRESVESLAERLRAVVIDFESKHPRLAGVLNQLVDGLANLGI